MTMQRRLRTDQSQVAVGLRLLVLLAFTRTLTPSSQLLCVAIWATSRCVCRPAT